jgi:hypothetical protein
MLLAEINQAKSTDDNQSQQSVDSIADYRKGDSSVSDEDIFKKNKESLVNTEGWTTPDD